MFISYSIVIMAIYLFSLSDAIIISNELYNFFRFQKNTHENFDCIQFLSHNLMNMTLCVFIYICIPLILSLFAKLLFYFL